MTYKLYLVFLIVILLSLKSFAGNNDVFSSYDNSILQDDKDSLFSCDGPIIVYENDRINSYGVRPNDNGFSVYKKSISRSTDLTCYVDETLQSFSFKLKDTIKTETSVYPAPDKMFIISDIEGNFKGFQSILAGAGVIDADFKWTFSSGHLVFVGDMFDRSPNVTECLWLLYKLESEAEMQGGKIHFILGNHEVMNMNKDYRYVRQKYFINADSLKLDYSKWYAANTELGRWLRSKNCIEKIGDIVFVHGGISKDFPYAENSLDEINDSFRNRLD
ncbi:MAG: metallophosphoesterase, partial [Ignavibacteria bacterium]